MYHPFILISYTLQFKSSSFTNPEYKLVAIHSEHFLPFGSVLPIFYFAALPSTLYVSPEDGRLYKLSSPNSLSLPKFHDVIERCRIEHLNVFLVILNAEIKFHQYLHRDAHRTVVRVRPSNWTVT
jgi:hypothetical protein